MPEKASSSKEMQPFTIKVEINPDALKNLVEKGKLTPFMDAVSSEVGKEIESQTMEHLVKAAITKTSVGNISFGAYFDDEGVRCGNGRVIPWPHPRGPISKATTETPVRL